MEQRELVVRARQGDHDAFAVLAGAALARLDAVAHLILRDADLARDAVQEALVRAWRDLPRLREPERFDAWLHRLTVRTSIDHARVKRPRIIEVELTPLIDQPIADGTAKSRLHRALEALRATVAADDRPVSARVAEERYA